MDHAQLSIGEGRGPGRRGHVGHPLLRALRPAARARGASGQRRYGDEAVRRLEVIEIAKRAGFSLDEVRLLLDASDGGEPAHERLRALAESKLPEVEALIARAEAMREWLELARECSCSSLELCALFERR